MENPSLMKTQITATYGHGTENDFLILFDPQGAQQIAPLDIAKMCNRATGIGADGFIRIIKKSEKWFMDYSNSDGSIAEMCGNGIRVMARYLVERGYQPEGIFAIDTRAGIKHLRVPQEGDISVNMGQVVDEMEEIEVIHNGRNWNGFHISVGNPHAVAFVDSLDEVGALGEAPTANPPSSYPEGVNVEFVKITDGNSIRMRVFERGSGETRSCGTGTCAVALAATLHTKGKLPATWIINPPGGRLEVSIDGHSNATLTGPAVLIRDVDISGFLLE